MPPSPSLSSGITGQRRHRTRYRFGNGRSFRPSHVCRSISGAHTLKWAIIGRWKESEFPVWSLAYVGFWFVKALINSNPLRLFAGTPLFNVYLRALGAKIGHDVAFFSTSVPVCTDLLTVGDGTVVRKDSLFKGYRAYRESSRWPRDTGQERLVGEQTVLDIYTDMGDDSQLGHSSALHRGQTVPANEVWYGSPGRRSDSNYRSVEPARVTMRRKITYSFWVVFNRIVGFASIGSPRLRCSCRTTCSQVCFGMKPPGSSPTWWSFPSLLIGGIVAGLVAVAVIPRLLNLLLFPGKVYPLYGFHYATQRIISRLTNLHFFNNLTGDSSLILYYLSYRVPPAKPGANRIQLRTRGKARFPYMVTVGSGTMIRTDPRSSPPRSRIPRSGSCPPPSAARTFRQLHCISAVWEGRRKLLVRYHGHDPDRRSRP